MSGNTSNGSRNGARSGAQTLLLLAMPLNVAILRALAEGPKPQLELRRQTGSPPQTTLRAQLKKLTEISAVEKHRRNRFPGTVEYELTGAGRELLAVAETLEHWLRQAPDGPLSLESATKAAIKALAEGWSTTILRALAGAPLSLTELDRLIAPLSYPSLERRLGSLRMVGLIEPTPGNGRGTPYAVAEWLRLGMGPLAAAARWERRRVPHVTPPFDRLDVETIFLLVVPSLALADELEGSCRMAAELSSGGSKKLAGVSVVVEAGAVTACTSDLSGRPDAWAQGSAGAWLDAIVRRDLDRLELGGDRGLAQRLIGDVHRRLFAAPGGHRSNAGLDAAPSIGNDRSN